MHTAVLPGASSFSVALDAGLLLAIDAGRASFTIPNPGGKAGDELPWTRTLASELQRTGVPVVMYQVP